MSVYYFLTLQLFVSEFLFYFGEGAEGLGGVGGVVGYEGDAGVEDFVGEL